MTYKKTQILLLTLVFLFSFSALEAQTYRYLKIEVTACDNFKINELNWYANGIDYPNPHLTATYASGNPNGELAFGIDPANWTHLNVYDGDEETHMWYGYITDPDLALHLTLDLGIGNAILPDSVQMMKPTYSVVTEFKIWASNDNDSWVKYLDTTITDIYWEAKTFDLELISDIEPPTEPTNLLANYITDNSLKLSWIASSDNTGVKEYEIFQNGESIGITSNTDYYVSGLSANTNYYYYLLARDFEPNNSDFSNEVSVFTAEGDIEAPSAPLSLVSDFIGNNSADFSWTNSIDDIAVIGYVIYLDGNSVGTTNENSFTIPGLAPSTVYDIAVAAKDGAGNKSLLSNTLTITTITGGNDKMKVGSNFWTVDWGDADPFVNMHTLVTEENPWNKELLDEVRIYGGFRFMDWARTNNLFLNDWNDRVTLKDINQNEVAYEWMIDFCNKTNKDIWICIPHRVINRNGYERGSNHFVKKLAILLKTGVDMGDIDLDDPAFINLSELTRGELLNLGGSATCKPLKPHLKIYIEYSNETWNWGFNQTKYSHDESKFMNLNPNYTGDPDKDWTSWIRFHSWAALRVFEQMEDVLGANTPRLMKLDSYQAVNVSDQINRRFYIYQDVNGLYNPRGIFPDAFCPGPYFGGAESNDMTVAFPEFMNNITEITQRIKGTRAFLDAKEEILGRKFKLIGYEGGQHDTDGADIINRAPEMYDLYMTYLDSMNVYLDEFWHYNHVARFGDGGAWGAKEYIGAPESSSPKYRALKDWIGGDPLPALDTIPPTAPTNLLEVSNTKAGFAFSWDASTDNVEVYGYKVYLNGFYIGSTTNTFFEITGLTSSSSYDVTVRAVDPSGNISLESDILVISTLNTYAVTFSVSDDISTLENAIVDFNGRTILTDELGAANFVNLLPGNWNYSVSKDGYTPESGNVDLIDVNIVENVELGLIMSATAQEEEKFITIYYDQGESSFVIHSDEKIEALEVFTMSGIMIQKLKVSSFNAAVSVQGVAQGIYFIKVSFADGHTKTFKVFKS